MSSSNSEKLCDREISFVIQLKYSFEKVSLQKLVDDGSMRGVLLLQRVFYMVCPKSCKTKVTTFFFSNLNKKICVVILASNALIARLILKVILMAAENVFS